MTKTLTLKKEAKQKIDQLSDDKLKVAFDFLSYLEEKEEWEATEELSQIPNLLEEYRQAKSKIKAGQTIKWSEIRRDV